MMKWKKKKLATNGRSFALFQMGEEKENQRELNITLLLQKEEQCKFWKIHERKHGLEMDQFLSQRLGLSGSGQDLVHH